MTFNQSKIMRTQLLAMFKFVTILSLLFFMFSCDPDDRMNTEQYIYNVSLENTSQESLIIEVYKTKDHLGNTLVSPELINTIIVQANSISKIETIKVSKPLGNPAFGFTYPNFVNMVDSITLKFTNVRGYYSSLNNNNFWLENRSDLLNIKEKDVIQKNGVLIYTINQNDYENAHVLPQ